MSDKKMVSMAHVSGVVEKEDGLYDVSFTIRYREHDVDLQDISHAVAEEGRVISYKARFEKVPNLGPAPVPVREDSTVFAALPQAGDPDCAACGEGECVTPHPAMNLMVCWKCGSLDPFNGPYAMAVSE